MRKDIGSRIWSVDMVNMSGTTHRGNNVLGSCRRLNEPDESVNRSIANDAMRIIPRDREDAHYHGLIHT